MRPSFASTTPCLGPEVAASPHNLFTGRFTRGDISLHATNHEAFLPMSRSREGCDVWEAQGPLALSVHDDDDAISFIEILCEPHAISNTCVYLYIISQCQSCSIEPIPAACA